MSVRTISLVGTALLALAGAGCTSNQQRFNMVEQPGTGLAYGSVIEKAMFIDAEQFENRRIKVTARNTSGDVAFNLGSLTGQLEQAYAAKGYEPASSDHGIRLDINVLYSGHIQRDMAAQYGFLGGAAGGIAGYRSSATAGTAIGILAGATIGSILGSTQTDDTYIVIAEVTLGVADPRSETGSTKTVVFGSSPDLQPERTSGIRQYRSTDRTRVAVYGGGRNTAQSAVAGEVKRRLIRITADVI